MSSVFITGTDTNVGKTHFSCALLQLLKAQRISCVGLKPIASGCALADDGQLKNEDALALMEASSVKLSYREVNPYAFEPPISPHLAARSANRTISLSDIADCFTSAQQRSQFVLVEGAGGWLSPLADGLDHVDLARTMDLPVLLVVGVRLGCINHARLSCQVIARDNANLIGWVASVLPNDMQAREETIDALQALLPVPMLARIQGESMQKFGLLERLLLPGH